MAKHNPTFTPEELQNEIWKPIPSIDDHLVSSLGRVARIKPPQGGRYLRLGIKNKPYYTHCLVMLAFVGPRPEGHEINHKDGNKHNNRPENLEYVTPLENKRHAKEMGLLATGDRNASRKYRNLLWRGEQINTARLTAAQVTEIRRSPLSYKELAEQYGVTYHHIYRLKKRRMWKHVD